MPMDWISCSNYGTALLANAQDLSATGLYKLPDLSIDEVDVVEDASDSLFCHRIVGTIAAQKVEDTTVFVNWGWRIMPLQADIELSVPELPVAATNDLDDPDFANLRWWGERRFSTSILETTHMTGLDTISHPWWTNIDLKPKQAFGIKRNLWPCLVLWNGSADDLRVVHRLRMLVGYR